jgi:hypothetical protein
MGNYLSFIDIYNKITVAAAAGDYQTVVYQVARLVRRLLDFDSMQNSALMETTMRLSAYVNYFARLGDDSDASDNIAFEQLNERLGKGSFDFSMPEDPVSFSISVITGFMDGSFRATNTSLCRISLQLITGSFANATLSHQAQNENLTVWFGTRVLKYLNPSLFHCYYAGKETVITIETYYETTTWRDIVYNLIYKSGQVLDQLRIIYYLITGASISDQGV